MLVAPVMDVVMALGRDVAGALYIPMLYCGQCGLMRLALDGEIPQVGTRSPAPLTVWAFDSWEPVNEWVEMEGPLRIGQMIVVGEQSYVWADEWVEVEGED